MGATRTPNHATKGTAVNGKQTAVCLRCGIERQVRPDRGYDDLCFDCILVERDLARDAAKAQCSRGLASKWGDAVHHRNGERCLACADARNATTTYYRRLKGTRPMGIPQHGTLSGYRAHMRRKQKACDACQEAKREYDRTRRREVA